MPYGATTEAPHTLTFSLQKACSSTLLQMSFALFRVRQRTGAVSSDSESLLPVEPIGIKLHCLQKLLASFVALGLDKARPWRSFARG